MYEIYFYKDKNGKEPIKEYIAELAGRKDKDSRIMLNKIMDAESNLQVSIIGELIKARQEKGISQKKLEELSGVKQPIIAKMEKEITSPQLTTILKVLAPLGKTLAVVPLETAKQEIKTL